MSTMTASMPSASAADADAISLFQLGILFVIRVSYWSCKAGNEAEELALSQKDINAKAIVTFGTKDLIAPDKGRKVFQGIEKKARHELEKYSRPFPATGAHFVPWQHVTKLVES